MRRLPDPLPPGEIRAECDECDCEWSEVEEVAPGVFRVRAVEIETPAQKRTTKAPKVRAAKPARLTAVPAADALAVHGKKVIAWQQTPQSAWTVAWSTQTPTTMSARDAWELAKTGHRAREYNRGGKCVRDSRDEGAS